ncbi:hypothetical protein SAMN05216360_109109 [Methylobacterium phyllostachyos]|uniref:Outer membrane protein n=1 Tax=Methylobacterium phyllostachyos TaxID=582672 RepID=A0A1H0CD50_9HYPH|nr:SIMPL domain-containing protein [Methylobacterium phyllostachyos]SDN55711.1 hypothetical protein SAMN05216360_109109 [Methylobacterium phyllostachyos]
MRAALAGAILILALASGVRADDASCLRKISVTGQAHVSRTPDFAQVSVGVDTKAQDPAEAVDAASKAVKAILDQAHEFGVDAADIGTASLSLVEETQQVRRPNGEIAAEPAGYRAVNLLTIRLADMNRLGELLRRVLSVGANKIHGISFGIKDADKVTEELETAAARNAQERARALATAVGVKLGDLCALSTEHGPSPVAAQAFRFSGASRFDGPSVPIAAGILEYRADVSATFAVAQ